jgi:hypothetical protein
MGSFNGLRVGCWPVRLVSADCVSTYLQRPSWTGSNLYGTITTRNVSHFMSNLGSMQGVDVSSLLSAELPVIVFLTKIDECEPGLVADLGQTFHSEKLYKLVQVRIFQHFAFHLQAGVVTGQQLSTRAVLQTFKPHLALLNDPDLHRVRQDPTLEQKKSGQ